MELISFVLLLATIGTIFYFLFGKRNKNLPPGPKGIPIFGNMLQIDEKINFYKVCTDWAKEYGPIFTLHLGSTPSIILNDPQLIREAFNLPALSGRPNNQVFLALGGGPYGVLGVDGEGWSEQRRFTLKHLKNFGFGKNQMETLIVDEAKELIEGFRKEGGLAFNPTKRFSLAVLNSLWIIVTGSRFNQDDDHITQVIADYFKQLDETFVVSIISFFPLMASVFPEWSGYNELLRTVKKTTNFFAGIVTEHENTMTENDPRDYIDAYLEEIKRSKSVPNSSFSKTKGYKNLFAIIGDLFAAGAETTSTTLNWSVLYLAVFPEAQKKFQNEIDEVVGQSKLPSLADRPNMPYTEALMYEILRFSSIASIGLFHRATEEVEFRGYTIPKDVYIVPNFHRCHYNPVYWDEPETFRPERFLVTGEDSKVKVQRRENLMPFSVGKRVCLGESLARDEFFIFLTCIFQRFDIQVDPNSEKPSLKPQVTFIDRPQPQPFKVIMKDRQG